MTILNPVKVARRISENIRNGKKINQGEIIRSVGYSKNTSLKPKLVTETQAYKQEMLTLNQPLIEGIQEHITKLKQELANRNLSQEEYRTLVGSLDIYIKNYQLLSGGATERQVFVIPSEIMAKNNIITTDTKDKV